MKKNGLVFALVTLLLSAAGMLLRKLELLTALDADGLAVFRPATASLIALSVLMAAFCILYARKELPAQPGGELRSLGPAAAALAAVCLPVQLYGAWLLFGSWKGSGDTLALVLALLAGLAGAGWLYLHIAEWQGWKAAGSRLLAGSLITLFHCLWLISYYRDEAPQPALILPVYGFLALCAGCIAAYGYTGGSVGRLRPRRTLVFCGLAVYLSLVALVRGESAAWRLFWLTDAVQFCLCALQLLLSGAAPEAPLEAQEPETVPESREVPEPEAAPESLEMPEPREE